MSSDAGAAGVWPADVIHVNEDGWVLINRGQQHGIPVGLRLLVVGAGARELRDLFANESPGGSPGALGKGSQAPQNEAQAGEQAGQAEEPVVLRTRRTYELLEVVHVEPACAVAIAARTPSERRPHFYRGPQGELLVWVPLPSTFTYPQPNAEEDEEEDEEQDEQPYDQESLDGEDGVASAPVDVPPQRTDQEDERWEEALPLNGVGVGDQVVPAMPVGPSQPTMPRSMGSSSRSSAPSASSAGQTSAAGASSSSPYEEGKDYDWMKPQS